MGEENSSSSKDSAEKELILQYEELKKEGKSFYLDVNDLITLTTHYVMKKNMEEAQEVLDYGMQLHPDSIDLQLEQTYLYLDTAHYAKAEAFAENIPTNYSNETKILKAEILLLQRKPEEAEEILQSLTEKEDLENVVCVANLYIQSGYPDRAFSWLKIREEETEDEEYLSTLAHCLFFMGKNEEAIRLYDQLLDNDPYNAEYWTGIAKNYLVQSNFEKAIEATDFALAADEEYGDALALKAHCCLHLGNGEKAAECYQKAKDHKALSPDLTNMFMGICYLSDSKWEEANRAFDAALAYIDEKEDPCLADIYYNKIICLNKLGKYKEAHRLCGLTKKLEPNAAAPSILEARLYLLEGNLRKAKKEWNIALSIAPTVDTWMQMADAYQEVELYKESYRCLLEAKKLDPDLSEINEQLATLSLITGDFEAFFKYNALTDDPLNPKDVYEKFKQWEDFPKETLAEFNSLLEKFNNSDNIKKTIK